MKISFAEYAKKVDVSVLVAQAIFTELAKENHLKQIKDVADTTSGGTPSRSNSNYYNGSIPWMKSGELNEGIITEIEETITEEGLKNSSAKIFPKGTLVIAMYGATAGKVGILGLDAASNQAVCAIFPNGKVDRDYMFWFLRQYRYEFIEISKGGAQPNISQGVINKTQLPVPDLETQKAIVAFLKKTEEEGKLNLDLIPDRFNSIVRKLFSIKNTFEGVQSELTHQQTLLTRLRQSILQEAVQGKLTAQWRQENPNVEPASELLRRIREEKAASGKKEKPLPPVKVEEMPFELPEGWVWCRLGDACTKITDGFHNTPPKSASGYPYISATHVKSDKIDWESCHYVSEKYHKKLWSKNCPQRGELLVVNIGAGCGTPAIIDVDYEFSFKNTAILKFNQSLLSNKYLFYFFLLSREKIYTELTKGGLQPFLSLKILNDIFLQLPPLPEQQAIVATVERLLGVVGQLEAESSAQRALAAGLLQAALREAMSVNGEG